MSAKTWFQQKLNAVKDSFDFRFETQLFYLTEKICSKMADKGINRTELANRLNVTPPAVTKILKGNSNFTLKTLLMLADALEMDLKIDFEDKSLSRFQIISKTPSIGGLKEGNLIGIEELEEILVSSGTIPLSTLEKKDPAKIESEFAISQTA